MSIVIIVLLLKWLWPSINKSSIRTGIILGLLWVLIEAVVIYMISPSLLFNIWFLLSVLILLVFLTIWFGIKYRNREGGYLSFGLAYKFAFLVTIFSEVIYLPFAVLQTAIHPEIHQILAEADYQSQLDIAEFFEEDPVVFHEVSLDELRQQAVEDNSRSAIFSDFTGYELILIVAFFSLIEGAFIKKKKPQEP